MAFAPRWYQAEAVASIHNYFGSGGRGNPVVAMPTGTGKSVVIAQFIMGVMQQWPNQRMMMITHVKELIEQNAEKLLQMWPSAPLGIYSAGLNSRDMRLPLIFGGIQSIAPEIKRADPNAPPMFKHFGFIDLIIIDECHLLSEKEDSGYQYVIDELRKINPNLKVIGLTATPYRTKIGTITDNGIFTDMCYDITDFESFNRLVREGFLAPLVARMGQSQIDMSEVKMRAGEFVESDVVKAMNKDDTIVKVVNEIIYYGYGQRKAWLMFATGIETTEHMASIFQSYGMDVLPVHSKLNSTVNDETIAAFKAGEILGIVNGQKLTTGFDHPPIDLIGDANPTSSPGKHVQKMGRGTRPCEGKENCLYLDFGRNVERLGPINDPIVPNNKRRKSKPGDAPVKLCPNCGIYAHTTARVCENCEFEFPKNMMTNVSKSSSTFAPMRLSEEEKVIETFEVSQVFNTVHRKANTPPSIRVTYACGLQSFSEFVTLEHQGYAKQRAREWWKMRHGEEPPKTTEEAMQKFSELRVPKRIRVWVNKKYPEILSVEM